MSAFDPMRRLPLLLALFASPALSETPLTAAEFEAHVLGKTVTYSRQGGVYGIEEYLDGRRVRWSAAPNLCQYGSWFADSDAICFVYDDNQVPQCWTFWLRDGRLVALSTEAAPGSELYETEASTQGLSCPGPDVGV